MQRVLIVGFGAAGLACAEGLRQAGYEGAITVLSAEPELPYDRPPLSKQYLSGAWGEEKLLLANARRIDAIGAEILWGRSAVALDAARRRVTDDAGVEHDYDALVIATGVQPVRLPGTDVPGVHVLRTRQDADALRTALADDDELLVIGGGFLGLEAAAAARELGKRVTVIEPLALPLGNRLPEPIARRLVALHTARGVDLVTGVGLEAVELDAGGALAGVRLGDGRTIPARTALVAVGARADLDWLAGSGIPVADGIVCDSHCVAAPGIWAAGDVARWDHEGLGRSIRLEHRMNAAEQGRYVARDILGLEGPFVPTPFFWTDHFDVRVQAAGDPEPTGDPELAEGEIDGDSFLMVHRGDGRLRAGIGWNAPRSLVAVRRELSEVPV